MIELFGHAASINVRKVLWLAMELGLELVHEARGGDGLPLSDPGFLKLNPKGLVPVLRDGDLVLTESNTICRYLAAREGRTDLLPQSPRERAQVEQWMDWQATDLNTAWRPVFMGRVRRHPDFQDEVAMRCGVEAWNRQMGLLEQQLQRTGAFVTGPVFTLADIVLGLSAHRWASTPMDRPEWPALRAWCDRLATRPGHARYCTSGWP